MRPSCKHPPGVVRGSRGEKLNFSVNGVRGSDDRDRAVIILEKKARPAILFSVLVNNACDLLSVLLSPDDDYALLGSPGPSPTS